ncbi:MAG TPA: M23 family metallopeptidase, partial [Bacillota bacterium]|nr:M23 family metallopeptidase [Bacillota bacterium]
IKSCRIPFTFVLIILAILLCNIYVFIGYITQIWSINHFKRELSHKDRQIVQLIQDQKKVKPTLQKSYRITAELNRLKQERLKLLDEWKKMQQKYGQSKYPVSRGRIPQYSKYKLLKTVAESGDSTELAIVNNNLEQIERFIEFETREQQLLKKEISNYQRRMERIPSLNPVRVSRITSWFGKRIHPKLGYSKLHTGIDLRAKVGTKVVAAAEGIVVSSGYKSGYGYTVIIDHSQGYETLYAHNSKLVVKVGQKVKRGELISYSGNTGTSTGPHLHYEVKVDGKPVNPAWFLKN